MKKIFKYVPIILGLVMVMSSCGDDDETEPEPAVVLTPTLSVSVNSNQVANGATVNAETGSSITLAITANKIGSGKDLNTMTITQSGDNVVTPFNIQAGANDPYTFGDGTAQTLRNSDDETFVGTGVFTNITGSEGTTTYNITVTDNDGLSTTVSFSILVANAVTSTPFTMTESGFINHIAGRGKGSWSLENDTTVAASMAATMADITNTDAAGDAFTGAFKVGDSRTTTDFVVAGSFNYDNADLEMATAAYNSGNKVTSVTPSENDVYIFNVNGTITVVKVTDIDPSYSEVGWLGNFGRMTFDYKK